MTASGEFDTRPVRAFLPGPDLRDGLELPAGLTVLVGENGSGKVHRGGESSPRTGNTSAWRQFMRDPQGFFRHLFEA